MPLACQMHYGTSLLAYTQSEVLCPIFASASSPQPTIALVSAKKKMLRIGPIFPEI